MSCYRIECAVPRDVIYHDIGDVLSEDSLVGAKDPLTLLFRPDRDHHIEATAGE